MQIAVAHVAECADLQPVLFGGRLDKADHLCQFAARHGGIFEDGRWRHARQRGKSAPPGAGELPRLGFVFGHTHFQTAVVAADFFHLRRLFSHHDGMTVGLHQQQRLAIQGKSDLRVILDAMNR